MGKEKTIQLLELLEKDATLSVEALAEAARREAARSTDRDRRLKRRWGDSRDPSRHQLG
jgi:DNA-binding Lrp family transcriptional regulator